MVVWCKPLWFHNFYYLIWAKLSTTYLAGSWSDHTFQAAVQSKPYSQWVRGPWHSSWKVNPHMLKGCYITTAGVWYSTIPLKAISFGKSYKSFGKLTKNRFQLEKCDRHSFKPLRLILHEWEVLRLSCMVTLNLHLLHVKFSTVYEFFMQAWNKTYFSRVNFTVSSLWVATMIFGFLLCLISSSKYSKHLEKQQGRWLRFRHFLAEPQRVLMIFQHLLMIHPVSGLIVRVYRVFVANLFGPVSLLVHVGATNQFGTKVPAFPSWHLNVHNYIAIGFLRVLKNTKGYH